MSERYEDYGSLPDGHDVAFWMGKALQAGQSPAGGDVVRTDQLENYLVDLWTKLEGRTVPADAFIRAMFQVLRLTQHPTETVALSASQFEALAVLGIEEENGPPDNVVPLPLVQTAVPVDQISTIA